MSSRTGRQKQMMNVVPPVTPAQRQQTQQPLQRQPQPQQRQQPPPPPQRQPPPQLQRQPPAVQIQEKQEKQQKPKMTIGDAIGLITIRLGRVEQFIQQLQTDGIEMNSINSTQPNDFMDNGLLQNLVSRLNTIEEYSTNTATDTATEHRLKNMETDLKDTKDLIIKLMLKFENFSDDTHAKFEEQQHQISFNLEQLQQEPQEPQEQQKQQELQKQEHQEPEEQDQQVTPEEALPTSSNESEHVP